MIHIDSISIHKIGIKPSIATVLSLVPQVQHNQAEHTLTGKWPSTIAGDWSVRQSRGEEGTVPNSLGIPLPRVAQQHAPGVEFCVGDVPKVLFAGAVPAVHSAFIQACNNCRGWSGGYWSSYH